MLLNVLCRLKRYEILVYTCQLNVDIFKLFFLIIFVWFFNFQKYNLYGKNRNNITLNSVYNKVATTQEIIHNKANTKLKIK